MPTFAHDIWRAVGGDARHLDAITVHGAGELPSVFAVSDLATGSIAAAGLAIAELIAVQGNDHRATGKPRTMPAVGVDHRLASFWFGETIRPDGWSLPPPWDPIAGDYKTVDGWIRLHTNAPHHRAAALAVLACPEDKTEVTAAVSKWTADDLEAAVVLRGGCAAAMRDLATWADHPHGKAVAAEPLVWLDDGDLSSPSAWQATPDRPLAGVRVLDLTRVLAGPVATRFLAGFGADVLRIDPLGWDEPGVIPNVALGKRCARLDLHAAPDRAAFDRLLASTDILVHGYRPDALSRLGLDPAARRRIRPGLIDVSLDAYGWSGPWQGRRGFDSLVQMSTGIAAEGMRRLGSSPDEAERPRPLPVQALDHATGYIMAAAAVRGLTRRVMHGVGSRARASLARTAALLASAPVHVRASSLAERTDTDFSPVREATGWGPASRLKPPLAIEGAPMRWDYPARPLGSSEPVWAAA